MNDLKYSRVMTQESSVIISDDDSCELEEGPEEGPDADIVRKENIICLDTTKPVAIRTDSVLEEGSSEGSLRPLALMIGNNTPNPFTRRPLKARDFSYAILFFLHFVLVSVLSGSEDFILHDSFTTWSSIIIIATILGSIICLPFISLFGGKLPELIILPSFQIAFFGQIFFGYFLCLLKSIYSVLGIIMILFSFCEIGISTLAAQNLSFYSELLQMARDITKTYGISLSVTCFLIIFGQTCVLLWWGVLAIGLITKQPSEISQTLIGTQYGFYFTYLLIIFYIDLMVTVYFSY